MIHPESVDPPWFQELVRRAWERELVRLRTNHVSENEATYQAMWYVFDLRNNLAVFVIT